jgi:hypothetical protein
MKIVVAEKLAENGLSMMRKAGHEVVVCAGAPRERLLEALRDADALMVRSATQVDRALFEAAPKLTVVARAGVGVDNVDVAAATARGVLVLNAPTANVLSAVEHTFALLFALLRRVPEAANTCDTFSTASTLSTTDLGAAVFGKYDSFNVLSLSPNFVTSSNSTDSQSPTIFSFCASDRSLHDSEIICDFLRLLISFFRAMLTSSDSLSLYIFSLESKSPLFLTPS